jgi:catechol 2,3-dioxygenase-like lactoylglutathione lyase family enzyme
MASDGQNLLTAGTMVGFLVTTDYEKARAFYVDSLGFEFVSHDQFALAVRAGTNVIRINRAEGSKPAQGTVLGWQVADVRATVLWLKSRGVETTKYPFVEDKELGIWKSPGGTEIAWFTDPDGNVLSVNS